MYLAVLLRSLPAMVLCLLASAGCMPAVAEGMLALGFDLGRASSCLAVVHEESEHEETAAVTSHIFPLPSTHSLFSALASSPVHEGDQAVVAFARTTDDARKEAALHAVHVLGLEGNKGQSAC